MLAFSFSPLWFTASLDKSLKVIPGKAYCSQSPKGKDHVSTAFRKDVPIRPQRFPSFPQR